MAGAIQKDVYLELIKVNGFEEITVQKIKPIDIPSDILSKYLSAADIAKMKDGTVGIFSLTVFAKKPMAEKACCTPGSGCC